ncbi:gamma-glutamyl-gamma-aminobutyrate hydrolase family protein [Oleidesulfovibrio sp.]|uniref:gamma-glutamyl-gamma-aminobutyrate hydrolase family protein n=1 Tax=Oleidesulfovibrio sp. TaxID=2909707 RepID=UPI003A86F83D
MNRKNTKQTRHVLAVSQRICVTPHEVRDALAQDWARFLSEVLPDAVWVPVPNGLSDVTKWFDGFSFTGLILTGGEDWSVFPHRDSTEGVLFAKAMRDGLPILGVCRGMQIINRFLGGTDLHVPDHVAVRHSVMLTTEEVQKVNSFHARGITDNTLAPALLATALASDGTVEAFEHCTAPVYGMMWHPEREAKPHPNDIKLFRQFWSQ